MAVSGQKTASLVLICGEDDFTVKERARLVFQQWASGGSGFDQEIIEAGAANSGEALRALNRLREALQTLPFFGQNKIVWFKDCSFLGDDRTGAASAVTENLASLAEELRRFSWDQVRLLISAGKVDKRKSFYKSIEKTGQVEIHDGLTTNDKDWAEQTEAWAQDRIRKAGKQIRDDALSRLVNCTGPDLRLLSQEVDKLMLYVGSRPEIESKDVDAIVTRQKQAQAFALGDALGDRDLPRLLRALDDELGELKTVSQKSEIGILYGLIAKIRALLFLKGMIQQGWLRPESDYPRFKMQLEKIPPDLMPSDKRLNPLTMHPYILFKALGQCRHYTLDELIQAMERLLECNRRLVSSDLDPALLLQQTLIKIASEAEPQTGLKHVGDTSIGRSEAHPRSAKPLHGLDPKT